MINAITDDVSIVDFSRILTTSESLLSRAIVAVRVGRVSDGSECAAKELYGLSEYVDSKIALPLVLVVCVSSRA